MSQQPWNSPQQGMSGGPQQGGSSNFGGQPWPGSPASSSNSFQSQPQHGNFPQQGVGFSGPSQCGSASPGGPGGYGGLIPPKKKSKAPMIIGGVLGAGLLAGAGYFAFNFFNGASASAATVGIPKSAMAVIEVSLNPSNNDKLALKEILEKFPSADSPETDDYKEALWNVLTSGSENVPDYQSEIKPWLGDSISIGLVKGDDAEDAISNVVAIEVTDESKAKAFAEKELTDGDNEFFFHDGLMIFSEEGVVDEAKLKEEGSIKDYAEYKADMDALEGNNLASVWFDSAIVNQLIADSGQLSQILTPQLDALNSMHGAIGIQVEKNLLTAKFSTFSESDIGKGEDIRDVIGSLPQDSSFAVGTSISEESATQIWNLFVEDPLAQQWLAASGITSEDDLKSVIGKKFALSLGESTETVEVGLKVTTDNPAKHEEILPNFFDDLSMFGLLPPFEHDVDGNTVTYATGYPISEVKNGKLKDSETYKKVVTKSAQAILFLDVQALLTQPQIRYDMDPSEIEMLQPIAAVGMVDNYDGKRSNGEIKVAFN